MAGKRLYLNLDARAQAVAEQALGDHRGAVVAIQPSTGAVLVFASTPTYDANAFVNGIDPAAYRALLNDPDKPLIDRALNGQYAPGSTIKAFLGLADIEVGSAVGMPRQIVCDGSYHLPGSAHQFRDWKRGGHGPVMLRDAIIQSCDVFFYRLAVALGPERIHDFLAPFGFGSPTGIDLPGESSGLLPTPEWKQAHGQTWYPGDTVVIGIGQGLLLVTPLQLADAMATIANHGVRMKPELLHAYTNPRGRDRTVITPKVLDRVPVKNKDDWNQLISYLVGVVNSPHGTARRIGYNAPYKIAGKTGTAQVTEMAPGTHYNAKETPERLRDHALFIGFAPADAPKVAVAVVVENGGHGGSTAAPVARKVMDQIILGGPANRKHPRGGLHNVARITKEQPR